MARDNVVGGGGAVTGVIFEEIHQMKTFTEKGEGVKNFKNQ